MDPTKMAPSFFTIIADEKHVFLTIPIDFATGLWGDKVPYCKTVQIRDGDTLRMVRIRKRNGEPVFTDGWIMLVRDHGLKYKDVVLIKAVGPQNFKGGMATVYFGDRFWNVKMDGWSDCSCLTAAWRRVVEEVPLNDEYFLVFTNIYSKTFDVSVFDPDTGTEVRFCADMDPTKMAPLFLTIIADEEHVFLTIPIDFATGLWGDKVPYCKTVQIRDGDTLRMVRIRKRNGEPVFTDGWIMLVRDHGLKYKDAVLIKAVGPQNFKGGMATVYFGDRFWNVKMDGWSDCSCLTAAWRRVVEEVPLNDEYFLVFTSIYSKTFDVSVFDPDTGTEVFLKKVEVVVLDHSIYGNESLDLFSTANADVIFESKSAAVYKAVEGNDAGIVSEYDLQGNSKDVSVQVVKGKSKVDAGQVLITKNEYQTQRTLRSRVQKVNAAPVIDSTVLKFTKLVENRIGCNISFSDELFFEFQKSTKLLILSKVVHKVKNKRSRA
ncbi:putative transcription factor B3-Domain family [Helianthus annuus]|uniref:Transcription factor B3-Domain family n=1 Tax=Helianthus annuus TaxID=4232 RepID=A0A9K3III5_HELAN|nr:putative transcription factor B3-Domain family [Helianthus annuus]KAJ0549358.1 putative transcription factor B3-Domain family [Helianthus annuus]KAJ0562311.1 putative transcription factor B3-Domain family [Helianthus annuus]KAJ0727687.1 putative transcription factor B3-Domain family [Helianthus annuus]KAJ0730483.1 putative transcription factor B3-Domain family [Helianthus annuus]